MIPRGLSFFLLLFCVVLGAIVGLELVWGAPDAAAPTVGRAKAAMTDSTVAPAPQANQNPSIDDALADTLARPLFSVTRRPAAATATASVASTDLANTRLTAIMIEPSRRLAVFAITGGKPLELAEGDTIESWRIDTIALHRVSLSGPAGTKTLEPKMDTSLVPAAPPARPAGGAPQPQPPGPAPMPPAAAGQPQPPGAGSAQSAASAARAGGAPGMPPVVPQLPPGTPPTRPGAGLSR